MISANELRIGNWVEWEDDSHEQVQVLSLSYIADDDTKEITNYFVNGGLIDDFLPIPLSPEWLERFTFQSEINLLRNHKLFIIDNYISLCHENKTFSVAIHSTLGAYPLAIKLSFVHQLQNLYFALTGKELELKQ